SLDMDVDKNRKLTLKELTEHGKQFRTSGRSKMTWYNRDKWWNYLEEFCEEYTCVISNLTVDQLIAFLGWIDKVLRKGTQVKIAIGSIANAFKEQEWTNLCNNVTVQLVMEGILRESRKRMTHRTPRLPFKLSALEYWVKNKPENVTNWVHARNSSLVAVGMRAVRRPGELGQFQGKHLQKVGNVYYLTLPWSKTDPTAKGKVIPFEPAENDSLVCPVKLLDNWLKICKPGKEDFIFPSILTRRGITGAAVSDVVRKMAIHAGLDGNYSGHSLRIGGATLMMASGHSMAQIRAIGGWESKAMGRYLQALGLVDAGLTKKMGF
ncbi:MAG: tyrosine-type recombinase/integrase, partial [Rhabdochlamydiaceae bacterium]